LIAIDLVLLDGLDWNLLDVVYVEDSVILDV
jgi:hypothetical protein